MGTLKKCLDKLKLGEHEKAILNGMVQDIRDEEGLSAHAAALEAVKEFRQQTEDDLADIEAQVTRKLELDYQGTGASAFNRWFGKSKAVDKKGRPRILYHGTTYPVDFDAFDTDPAPAPTYIDEDIPPRASGADPTAFLGAHFSETPQVANKFARGIHRRESEKETGRVYPVYLSIERPLVTSEDDLQREIRAIPVTHYTLDEYIDDTPDDLLESRYKVKNPEEFWNKYEESPEFRREVYNDLYIFIGDRYDEIEASEIQEELAHDVAQAYKQDLIDQNYDGIQYKNEVEGGTSWVAFHPWQIKSQFNLAPSKDKPQLLASMKKRADEKWLAQMARKTAEEIRRDAELNPKVAELVVALNKAGISTTGSGDLYGSPMVYVDVSPDLESALYGAQSKLPEGWKVTIPFIPIQEEDVLGKPIPLAFADVVKNVKAYTPYTRLSKIGTAVSPEEIEAIVKAIQASKAERKAKFSVKKTPHFKTTQEAWDFGKQATKEEVSLMRVARENLLQAVKDLGALEEVSDAELQAMGEWSYQAQLLREAIEASEGRMDTDMIKAAAWVHRTADDEGRFSIKNVLAWPDGFPRAVIHTTQPRMQRHADYRAAKDAGDYAAAQRLVKDLVQVDRAKDIGRRYPEAIIVPVIEWEAQNKDGKVNMIPLAYAFRLAELTGLELTTDIFNMSMGERTGKDAMTRMIYRPAFTGAVAPNRDYILVDDAITQGGTISELRHFIDNAGGTVVLSTSLTAQKDSTQIAPREGTLAELDQKFDPEKTRQVLADFDIAGSVQALTEGEAKYLAKFASLESFESKADERLRQERGGVPQQEARPSEGLIPEEDTHLVPASELGTFSVKKPSKKKTKLSPADEKLAQAIAGAIQAQLKFTDAPAYATIEGASPLEPETELTAFQTVRVQTTGYIAAAGNVARDAADVASVVAAIRKSAQEQAFMVVTGDDGIILEVHKHTKGSKGASTVHSIEMIGRAARIPGASMVYFIHNHPSGHPFPSGADVNVTERGLALAEQAGLKYQALIIAGTSWGTINPVGNYMTGETYPIRPTIRKTMLPVKERYQVKPISTKTDRIAGPTELVDYLKQNDFIYKTGVLFVNAQNQPVGFLRIGPSSGPQAATEILKAAEFTNATAAFINVTDAGETERTRSFFQHVTALTGGDLVWFDAVVRGVSRSSISQAEKERWVSGPSQDMLATSGRIKAAQVTTKHMEAKFSVRKADVRRAIERGLFNARDLAIAGDLEVLTALDEEIGLTRTGQPQGNAIAISRRIREEKPYLLDKVRAIEARTLVPLLDIEGNLLMHPMEAKTVTNIPGPTASQFYPLGSQRPWLIGALRTLTQTYLDNMHAEEREHFRKAIVKSIEMAYDGTVPANRYELGKSIKSLGIKQRPDKGYALARPLKRAHKTYAALNINTQCPMMIVGCHGCYLDGCYVVGTAVNGRAINFYRSAMYTGELLQLRDAEIAKLRAIGGLRINGMGDLTWAERFQMEDIVRHAHMRGLPLKIITKQDDTIRIIQWLIKNKVPGAREIVIQPSVDPYWVEVNRQDDVPGSAMTALQVTDMIAAGKLEPAAKFIRDELGRDAKVINKKVYRKYGYSWSQLQALSKKNPDVRMLPRVVVSSAKEIAEYALKMPEVLQTWMHATLRPGMWSEVEGKDVSEIALNFGDPIAIRKVDGEWRILRGIERGTEQVGEGAAYTAVENYIKENYSKADQEKIFKTLSGQLSKNESSLCCALGASLDACFDCQSSCSHGTYYTGAELRDIAARGARQLASGVRSIGKRDLLASVRRPVWYSSIEEFLSRPGQLPATSTAENYTSLVKGWAKSGKIKGEELAWSGLLDWLGKPREQKPTAPEILQFLRENNLRIREHVLTEEDEGETFLATQARVAELNRELHEMAVEYAALENEAVEKLRIGIQKRDDLGDGISVQATDRAWLLVNILRRPQAWTADKVADAHAQAKEIDPEFDWGSLAAALKQSSELEREKKELLSESEVSQGAAKFGPRSSYGWELTLPGGEGYTEVLLQLPPKVEPARYTGDFEEDMPHEEARRLQVINAERGLFYHQHWDPLYNILAHARFDTRFLPDYTPGQVEDIDRRIAAALKVADTFRVNLEALDRAVKAGAITQREAEQYASHRGFVYESPAARYADFEVLDLGEKAPTDWRYRVHVAGQPDNVLSHYPTRAKAEQAAAAGVTTMRAKPHRDAKTLFIQEIQSDWHERAFQMRKDEIERLMKDKGLSAEEAAKQVPKNFGYRSYVSQHLATLKADLDAQQRKVKKIRNELKEKLDQLQSSIEVKGDADVARKAARLESEILVLRERLEASVIYEDIVKQHIQSISEERVPDAPFISSWPMLVLKRMVKHAVDHGYDQVAWTSGDVQVERYNLGRRVDRIAIDPAKGLTEGRFVLRGYKDGKQVIEREDLDRADIVDLLGKEVGKRALQQIDDSRKANLTGDDLQVGGLGMIGFYDKILVNEANDFFNKPAWGNAKVAQIEIPVSRDFSKSKYGISPARDYGFNHPGFVVVDLDGSLAGGVVYGPGTKQDMQAWVRKREGLDAAAKAWALPITPEMKETSARGMPLFSVRRLSPFYSQMLDAVNDPKGGLPARGTPQQMLSSLQNMQKKGKFKAEEFEWVDLPAFFAGRPKDAKVSRDEIAAYIRAHGVPVTELLYGFAGDVHDVKYDIAFNSRSNRWEIEWKQYEETGEDKVAYTPEPMHPGNYLTVVLIRETKNVDPANDGYYLTVRSSRTRTQVKKVGPFETEPEAMAWANEHYVAAPDPGKTDGQPKYDQYGIGGEKGDNYRELLLAWSPIEYYSHGKVALAHEMRFMLREAGIPPMEADQLFLISTDKTISDEDRSFTMKTLRERLGDRIGQYLEMRDMHVDLDRPATIFGGTHFSPERDILCWVRFDERIDDDGKKVIFVYEIQSDWHQKGQREGYAKDATGWTAQLLSKSDAGFNHWQINDADGNYVTKIVGGDERSAIRKAAEGIPRAPWKNTWSLLALKRIAMYAAHNGFDRVTWSSGMQQYEQWGSERIAWRKSGFWSGMTYGQIIDPLKSLELYDKGVPIAIHELDSTAYYQASRSDLKYNLESYKRDPARWEKDLELVVGNVQVERAELIPMGGYQVQATEQYSGEVFAQFDPEEVAARAHSIKGETVTDKDGLRKVINHVMQRKQSQYSTAGYEKYLDKLTDKVWAKMQAEPHGEYLPRLEGMQAFYDRNLVTQAKEFFGKKVWGGAEVRTMYVRSSSLLSKGELDEQGNAQDFNFDYAPVWGFDLTDELKMAAFDRGLPMFSVKRLDPVSRVYLDAYREAVPDSLTTTQDDIEADPYDGLTDEEKQRLKSSDGIPVPSWLDRKKDEAREIWREMTRHRPFIDPTQYSTVADILRTHQNNPENSTRRAMQMMQGIVQGLKPKQYQVFSLSLIMDDMVRDIESGLLAAKEELPFGFTRERAVSYRDYLQTLAHGDAAIAAALARRQSFQRRIKEALVQAELLPEAVLEDDRYWHHQVLQYYALDETSREKFAGVGLSSDDIRLKKKGWQLKRRGSVQDYNTRYVETEYEWLAQALAQLETRSVMDRLRELTDITGSLKMIAKQRNLEAFYAPILAQLPEGTTYQDIRGSDLDPLAKYGKATARAIAALGKMADKGELRAAPEYDDILDGLAEWHQEEKQRKAELEDDYKFEMPSDLMEGGRLFKFMAHLMNNDLPGAPWAGSVFKAVRERNNTIRETLGDKFLTPSRIIRTDPDYANYTEWIPAPGQTWYKAWSIPDRLAAQVQAGEEIIDQEKFEKMRQLLARGRDPFWIVPVEIKKTLDGFDIVHDDHRISKWSAKTMAAWKQWTLISPFRVIKYNLNNMSGDLDIVFAYRPVIISKYLPAAIRDLYRDAKNKQIPQALREELDLAYSLEVLGSGWSVQEVSDVAGQLAFKKHMEALTGDEPHWIARTWRNFKGFTQYRENLLRFAAFRYFREQLRDGKTLYGASNRAEIDAIEDIDQRAAKLARELLGDYGNITHGGQWLRRHIMPFYAWMEVNAPRYVRLMRNVRHEGQGAGVAARAVGVVAKQAAWKTSKLAVKMVGFYVLVGLWNAIFFPDEDEELGEQQRRQLHLILGRREDGTIVSLRVQGAFSDALAWFGMEDAHRDILDVIQGKASITDIAKDSALATPRKIIGALGPQWKLPGELISGRSFYPEFLNPRPIRDRLDYVARTFSLSEPYNWAGNAVDWAVPTGMPMARPRRGSTIGGRLMNDLMALALYTADPGEAAYFDTAKEVRDFREEILGLDNPDKANALYWYKQSLRYGDLKSAERYLRAYMSFPGDTERGLTQSIKRAHPLGGLAKKDRQRFIDSLSPEKRRRLEMATTWYNQVYKSEAAAEAKRRALQPLDPEAEEQEPPGTTLRETLQLLK